MFSLLILINRYHALFDLARSRVKVLISIHLIDKIANVDVIYKCHEFYQSHKVLFIKFYALRN